MSDWLTKLEAERNKASTQAKAQAESTQKAQDAHYNQIQRSYEQNKQRIERIYDAVEKYVKRASGMGFKVDASRPAAGWMFITGSFTVWGEEGEGQTTATLELRPYNNGFQIHYNGRSYPTRKSFISFYRVTDRVIANWVKWSVGEGPADPVEDGCFTMIFWAVGIVILLGILLAIIVAISSR